MFDGLFEVPASTVDTQLYLLSLAFSCSFSSSLPSKLPVDTLECSSPCRGCWACSGAGSAAEKREQRCWARPPERQGGLERVLSPWYLCRCCCCFLQSWDWSPPVSPLPFIPTRRAGTRLQLSWGVAGG